MTLEIDYLLEKDVVFPLVKEWKNEDWVLDAEWQYVECEDTDIDFKDNPIEDMMSVLKYNGIRNKEVYYVTYSIDGDKKYQISNCYVD